LTNASTTWQAQKSTALVAGVLALIAALQWYRGHGVAVVWGALAGALLVCALIPPAARVFFRVWMAFAGILGAINTRILLSAFFYLVVTPVGFVVRLLGKDPLDRRGPTKRSYWSRRPNTRQTPEGFERAF